MVGGGVRSGTGKGVVGGGDDLVVGGVRPRLDIGNVGHDIGDIGYLFSHKVHDDVGGATIVSAPEMLYPGGGELASVEPVQLLFSGYIPAGKNLPCFENDLSGCRTQSTGRG